MANSLRHDPATGLFTNAVQLSGSAVTLPVTEQNAYAWAFVPPKVGGNGVTSVNYSSTGFSQTRYGKWMDGFVNLSSSILNGTVKFRFNGRRVGALFYHGITAGVLSFDIDGVAYGTLNCGGADQNYYNEAYPIATDLSPGPHILTITKLDTLLTSIQGFLVDTATSAQTFMRTGQDYAQMYDDAKAAPYAITTASTSINNLAISSYLANAVITNTTASPINVTLQNAAGTAVVGPFPVAANDCRIIQGPIFFLDGIKAIASATGCTITVVVQ